MRAFSCQETQGTVDEPRLVAYVRDPTPTDANHERSVAISYPLSMDKGDIFDINQIIAFDDWIRIELWERDEGGRDDRIGAVTVRDDDVGEHQTMLFSGPELGSDQTARYSITYDVAPTNVFEYPHSIHLGTLHCTDAQEAVDEVFLTVNNHWVWEHGRMETGDTEPVDRNEPFRGVVQVELWERDSGRSDLLGTMRIDLRDGRTELRHDYPHDFVFHRSSVDDARYRLMYRIEER